MHFGQSRPNRRLESPMVGCGCRDGCCGKRGRPRAAEKQRGHNQFEEAQVYVGFSQRLMGFNYKSIAEKKTILNTRLHPCTCGAVRFLPAVAPLVAYSVKTLRKAAFFKKCFFLRS